MLSSRAYSFRQKSRLAISLSWVAGYTNVVLAITCATFTSHMTGVTTAFAREAGRGGWRFAAFNGFVILSFFLGAAMSAVLTEGARRRGFRSKYLLPLAVEALFLTIVFLALRHHDSLLAEEALQNPRERGPLLWVVGSAAFAMGIQNATITKISGTVVRSTHLTGVITDLGIEGIQLILWYADRMRGRQPQRHHRLLRISRRHPTAQRVVLLACIFGSFLFGAVIGTVAQEQFHAPSLILPIVFLLILIARHSRRPLTDIREIDPLADSELDFHGMLHSLAPRDLGVFRLYHHRHSASRAPDFELWVDHLPRQRRVLILIISPIVQLDKNALLNLEAAIDKLQAQHRQLIISSITARQYRALETAGLTAKVGEQNICPDIEFAIATATNYLREEGQVPQARPI